MNYQKHSVSTILVIASLIIASPVCASSEIDRDLIESFADKTIGSAIENSLFPGAVLAIVEGNETIVLKGYGVRDIETKAPIDPRLTLVRTGSMGKLMTAIAILQLVETDRVNFDTDVNEYLKKFQVPATYPEPVTIRHLLSHRAGFTSEVTYTLFDEGSGGAVRTSPSRLPREFVRVRTPGLMTAYDNLGLGLLGFLLGDVYGSSHGEVIRDRILKPLGMTHTVMGIPADRVGDFATCHTLKTSGVWEKCRHSVFRDLLEGAGNVSTTASDMARFISAMLNEGKYQGGALLSPETFSEFTNMNLNRAHPLTSGMGWIAQERGPVGRRGFGHNGGSRGTLTNLTIFPNLNIGLFLSVNGSVTWPEDDLTLSGLTKYYLNGGETEQFRELQKFVFSFHDNFLKGAGIEVAATHPDNTRVAMELEPIGKYELQQLEGRYFPTYSISHNTFVGKFLMPFVVRPNYVELAGDGGLLINGKGPFVQSFPRYFEDPVTKQGFAFTHSSGEVFMGNDAFPDIKLRWHENPILNTYPMMVFLIVIFTSILYFQSAHATRRLLMWIALSSALVFVVCVVLEMEFAIKVEQLDRQTFGAALWRIPLQLALFGILLLPVIAVLRWHRLVPDWKKDVSCAFHILLIGVCGLGFFALAGYWGLLGSL